MSNDWFWQDRVIMTSTVSGLGEKLGPNIREIENAWINVLLLPVVYFSYNSGWGKKISHTFELRIFAWFCHAKADTQVVPRVPRLIKCQKYERFFVSIADSRQTKLQLTKPEKYSTLS